MGDFLLTIGFVLLFAWVARGLVGARELTWRRTLLAIFVGVVFGMAVAILLLVRDFTQDQEIEGGQIFALSLPFALIGTMGAIVVLELLFARRGHGGACTCPIRSRHCVVEPGSSVAAGR